jgi:hypothetical protein
MSIIPREIRVRVKVGDRVRVGDRTLKRKKNPY